MQIVVESLAQLPDVATKIIQWMGRNRVCLFYGDMGAGKTTLIKSICAALGVEDNVSSPTFSIVNEYHTPHGPVYHFDFYRLQNEQEAFDMGYEEYFYSGAYCFVEWPERISNLLPEDSCKIHIAFMSQSKRRISFS